jgi:hypothetical protein
MAVQYYMTANTTILFFDYLLTLPDEVRRDFSSNTLRLPIETTL